MLICRKWGSTDVRWKDANWLWSECQLALELTEQFKGGIDPREIYKEEETFWVKDNEKKKRLIRLICKVKNEKYDESKIKIEDVKIKIEDVKLVVKAVLDIELKVNE
jgi:hypothetical protein